MTKSEMEGLAWLIIIGLPIYGLYKFGEEVGWRLITSATAATIIATFFIRAAFKRVRRRKLMAKYEDKRLVSLIMSHAYWQGQTPEQLRESLGQPVDIDEIVFKTKKREVWKYLPRGKNRFGLRITLENARVVGWDQKA